MISVCYTSARPAFVPPRVREWLAGAADPETIEFVVTIDARHADHKAAFARLPRTRVFVNHGRPCCVDGWNLAARKAQGRILIQCSDDLHPPERWDAIIRDRLADGARSAVLAISDGFTARPHFIPHAIVTRRYYREFGYLFHDAYWSMWSDNELSAVAHRRGAVVDAFDIQFAHSHGQIHDDVRVRHEATHFGGQGQRTFTLRERHGFEPWIFDEFAGDDGGARLATRATADYITFMRDEGWVSHNYGELVGDAIANDADAPDVILHDTVGIDEAGRPRPTHFSFERAAADLPSCRLRAPDHSMVWRREIATSRRATSWARIRGLLRSDEAAPSLSSARSSVC